VYEALQAYYKYRVTGFHHRQKVFQWQLLSARIIFIVLIFLVLVGIYFSWVQFKTGIREKEKTGKGDRQEVTELSASPKGIRISSPVLGVIILTISLLFFFFIWFTSFRLKRSSEKLDCRIDSSPSQRTRN
jgi:uncharacterized membrane protein